METVTNWAASESGSEMLMALASSTLAILLATFIWKKIWPHAILLVKFIWKKIWPHAILLVKFIWKKIWPHAILLAKFIWKKIWPHAILLVKCVIKLSCALAGLAAYFLHRIFEHTAPVRAGAATTGAENDVELHERDGGKVPGRAQDADV